MIQEKNLRTKILPIPRSTDELVELFRKVLGLANVQEFKVTPAGVTVQRRVDDGEDVIPGELHVSDIDADFVLKSVEQENLSFDPEEHAYLRMTRAVQLLLNRRQRPCAVLAPNPELFAAFLGLDTPAETFFGFPILYFTADSLAGADKCVVIGGPTDSIRDAAHGIVVDMGE
ncbi:MAG TPA: hypothetical protein PLI95_29685 [Polyangiaceae bacterium]|nr:hypothetical protein [Polyangiaceae bacterium]